MTTAPLSERVLRVVRRTPNVRAVEIAERLGEPVVDVSRALRALRRDKRVHRRGHTKATTYRAA